MNQRDVILIFSAVFLLLPISARAGEKCEDLLIHFVEEGRKAGVGDDAQSDRQVTALITCPSEKDANSVSIPTTLHFMEHDSNRVCVSERTCGNVRAWSGYFGLSVGWSELSFLRDFYHHRHALRFQTDWNGSRLQATFALSRGQIERDCGPLTPPTCVEVSDLNKNGWSSGN
ncbi:MAG: hypothetical protein RIR26_1569 [Pseudomonadota bacterium]|jgi:hypothetical protein